MISGFKAIGSPVSPTSGDIIGIWTKREILKAWIHHNHQMPVEGYVEQLGTSVNEMEGGGTNGGISIDKCPMEWTVIDAHDSSIGALCGANAWRRRTDINVRGE